MDKKQLTGLILGSIGFVMPMVVTFPGLSFAGHLALSIFLVAAVFWLFEPVPIYATSMLVIFLEALLLSKQGVIFGAGSSLAGTFEAPSYAVYFATLSSPIIILFLGGFMLANAAVKYNLDTNLTRYLLKPFGTKPGCILLGLMLITAVLSAFMSNTATTAMMMTVIIPIAAKVGRGDPFKTGLALCIPIGANIGGIATPIGTPPNAVVIASLSQQGTNIAFSEWMSLALPLVVIMLVFAYVLLMTMFKPKAESIPLNLKGRFETSSKAWVLYGTFALTVLLWVSESFHGVKSSLVAFIPIAVFTLSGVLGKEDIRRLPWEVLWLVGGGISLGVVLNNTGLAEWLVAQISWDSLGTSMLLLVFAIVAVVMSNFLSNTVTATLLIPLAISMASSGVAGEGYSMFITSLVIGIAASLAMALPISTPPNAIAISSGLVETKHMARTGFVIGILGIAVVMLSALLFWPFLVQ